jgi:hypothetical protein
MLGREPRRLYSLSRSEPTRGTLRIDAARINNELAFHAPEQTRRADYFGAHCRPHDTAVFAKLGVLFFYLMRVSGAVDPKLFRDVQA